MGFEQERNGINISPKSTSDLNILTLVNMGGGKLNNLYIATGRNK